MDEGGGGRETLGGNDGLARDVCFSPVCRQESQRPDTRFEKRRGMHDERTARLLHELQCERGFGPESCPEECLEACEKLLLIVAAGLVKDKARHTSERYATGCQAGE